MSKNLGEIINHIMEGHSTKRVLILTNTMHILGTIHDYHNCENCHDCLIGLKDVKITRLEDLCNCKGTECECDFDAFLEYKWFNISVHSIIGFSIIS